MVNSASEFVQVSNLSSASKVCDPGFGGLLSQGSWSCCDLACSVPVCVCLRRLSSSPCNVAPSLNARNMCAWGHILLIGEGGGGITLIPCVCRCGCVSSAVVWVSKHISPSDLRVLDNVKDLKVEQLTPVRVVHRRSLLKRDKMVHSINTECAARLACLPQLVELRR